MTAPARYTWICAVCNERGAADSERERNHGERAHRGQCHGSPRVDEQGRRVWLRMEMPLPPQQLSPNAPNQKRGRHTEWRQAYNQYKSDCYFYAVDARNRAQWVAPPVASIFLEFCLAKRPVGVYAPEDWDNAVASVKGMFDALTAAEVIVDDDWKHLSCGGVRYSKERGPFVVVEITAIGGAA